MERNSEKKKDEGMQRITFELIQHTPIIHFQADYRGATLRASEVKPKLDRYLWNNYRDEIEKLGKRAVIGKKEKSSTISLDYKMSFVATNTKSWSIDKKNAPMYFANIAQRGDFITEKYLSIALDGVKMTLLVRDQEMKALLSEDKICDFFMLHNFGARQSKGYGSFTVKEPNSQNTWERAEKKYKSLGFQIKTLPSCNKGVFHSLSCQDFSSFYKSFFKGLDYFYKSLRSGLNEYRKDYRTNKIECVFYMKPVIYHYAEDIGEHWDKFYIKRKISTVIFKSGLSYSAQEQRKLQKFRRSNGDFFRKKNEETSWHEYRNMFGLSTCELWSYYNNIDIQRRFSIAKNNKRESVERMKSPIQFKPIILKKNNKYELWVYMGIFQEEVGLDTLLKNEGEVEVVAKNGLLKDRTAQINLKFKHDIKLIDILKAVFRKEDLTSFMEDKNNKEGKDIKIFLSDIYAQLKNNKKTCNHTQQ
ncbi:hypothetical protein HQ29_00375 [Porphyromonas canoris]|uniref:hypothetical protein n=1 Tax=Porphyromonas canoris TaxID=36875 RepID=UPI00051E0DE8|nr:hypothetical protein [Porphyromonas canoris]KGL53860.1 hypothetical protein HQ29_00375 [Porphyromonas canoris]